MNEGHLTISITVDMLELEHRKMQLAIFKEGQREKKKEKLKAFTGSLEATKSHLGNYF